MRDSGIFSMEWTEHNLLREDGRMKTHRAFARKNAFGYWEGCIEYPCGTVSAVTNPMNTEGAVFDIAQRMSEGADARHAKALSDDEYRRQFRLGRIMPGSATCIANT